MCRSPMTLVTTCRVGDCASTSTGAASDSTAATMATMATMILLVMFLAPLVYRVVV